MDQVHGWADNDPTIFAIIVLVVVIVHFVPSYVAFSRDHSSKKIILILNLLMGWTIIGWAALLFWASKGSAGRSLV